MPSRLRGRYALVTRFGADRLRVTVAVVNVTLCRIRSRWAPAHRDRR
jgi:hypothetical protein